MLLVRDIMYCKPGKVRPMIEKYLAMSKLSEKQGLPKMRVMTDVSAERYWTIVSEMEVESLDTFMSMGQSSDADMKEFETIMKGYMIWSIRGAARSTRSRRKRQRRPRRMTGSSRAGAQ